MFKEILFTLNCLNERRGKQAGFDLRVLDKVSTFKDNLGTSILERVCEISYDAYQEDFNYYIR